MTDQMQTEKAVESEGLARDIASNLEEAGYDGVDVDVADAEVRRALLIRPSPNSLPYPNPSLITRKVRRALPLLSPSPTLTTSM